MNSRSLGIIAGLGLLAVGAYLFLTRNGGAGGEKPVCNAPAWYDQVSQDCMCPSGMDWNSVTRSCVQHVCDNLTCCPSGDFWACNNPGVDPKTDCEKDPTACGFPQWGNCSVTDKSICEEWSANNSIIQIADNGFGRGDYHISGVYPLITPPGWCMPTYNPDFPNTLQCGWSPSGLRYCYGNFARC